MLDQPNDQSQEGRSAMSAAYTSTSGNEPFSINIPLATPQTTAPSTEERTAYLYSLRDAVLKVQDQVNKELTARMEQDNLKDQKPASGINDSKEEENYGEEAQEEE